jgi:phosphate starvation-inducible PhoH-like protein
LSELTVSIDAVRPIDFFGVNNARLNIIRKAFPEVNISSRGNKIKAQGNQSDISNLKERLQTILEFLEKYGNLKEQTLLNILAGVNPLNLELPGTSKDVILHGPHGNVIKCRTPNQCKMVELVSKNDIVFSIGPAGTGKTYTAVAMAIKALKNKVVKRIVLTRPAVEAGESLGFLPGDLKEKIDPYLRPLYDALDDMLPLDKINYYKTNRIIEIAPLAFMRGRTLDNAFIILDEAQNATGAQLKMFLTRLGPSAKCIVTGDVTQIDLPRNFKSGLATTVRLLDHIDGIATIYLTQEDVVRHRLVKEILKRYEKVQKEGGAEGD